MNDHKRGELRQNLRRFTETYRLMMSLLEDTFQLLCEQSQLDPQTYWEQHQSRASVPIKGLSIDTDALMVSYHNKRCFLGNTLPFHLLRRLAQRPNAFISHDRLFDDVWHCQRSKCALRSVVKELRGKLRRAGLGKLADAIDARKGGYRLRLGG
jgi:DNA-binding response OmpR family regulator